MKLKILKLENTNGTNSFVLIDKIVSVTLEEKYLTICCDNNNYIMQHGTKQELTKTYNTLIEYFTTEHKE